MPSRTYTPIWIAIVWWCAYALIFATQVVMMGQEQDIPVSWGEAFAYSFGGWLTWIPFSIGLYFIVRRYPMQRRQWLRPVLAQTAAVLAVAALKAAYVYLTNPIFAWYVHLPDFGSVLVTSLLNNVMIAWAVVAVSHTLLYLEHARDRGLKVAELEANLAAARLQAIRAQLNPHFMFNSLNSVAEMVHQDPEAAEHMLVALSRLLRDSLSNNQDQERPLSEEISLVEDYLMIEKYRLGERLSVDWEIDDACLPVRVPVLVMQPLVENAIVHSIARRKEPSRLHIAGKVGNDRLLLQIDNSKTPGEADKPGTGLGLDSVVSRLAILYGANASLTIDASRPDLFSARLDLPVNGAAR